MLNSSRSRRNYINVQLQCQGWRGGLGPGGPRTGPILALENTGRCLSYFVPGPLSALKRWCDTIFFILRGGPPSTRKSTLAKNFHGIFGWKPPVVKLVQDAAAADLQDLPGDPRALIVSNIDSKSFVLSHGPAWSLFTWVASYSWKVAAW